jgi:hypothetical protein
MQSKNTEHTLRKAAGSSSFMEASSFNTSITLYLYLYLSLDFSALPIILRLCRLKNAAIRISTKNVFYCYSSALHLYSLGLGMYGLLIDTLLSGLPQFLFL